MILCVYCLADTFTALAVSVLVNSGAIMTVEIKEPLWVPPKPLGFFVTCATDIAWRLGAGVANENGKNGNLKGNNTGHRHGILHSGVRNVAGPTVEHLTEHNNIGHVSNLVCRRAENMLGMFLRGMVESTIACARRTGEGAMATVSMICTLGHRKHALCNFNNWSVVLFCVGNPFGNRGLCLGGGLFRCNAYA